MPPSWHQCTSAAVQFFNWHLPPPNWTEFTWFLFNQDCLCVIYRNPEYDPQKSKSGMKNSILTGRNHEQDQAGAASLRPLHTKWNKTSKTSFQKTKMTVQQTHSQPPRPTERKAPEDRLFIRLKLKRLKLDSYGTASTQNMALKSTVTAGHLCVKNYIKYTPAVHDSGWY